MLETTFGFASALTVRWGVYFRVIFWNSYIYHRSIALILIANLVLLFVYACNHNMTFILPPTLLLSFGKESLALFISPANSDFFIRLQIFLHAGCNFLPPEELPPHAKNDDCGY